MSEQALAPSPLIPIPRGPVPEAPPPRARRQIEIQIDGQKVSIPEGSTILDAARSLSIDTPTLCFLESLTPVNVCRVCVVELEGSRTLVPACSRRVEPGMAIKTDSERVRLSRRIVLEFLASSVDVSTAPTLQDYLERYGARPQRFGVSPPPSPSRRRLITIFTYETTENAFSVTSALKLAAWMRRTLSRSPSPDWVSRLRLPPSSMFPCRIPPVSIAATASVSARLGR
jgi:hypothetical protein